MAAPGSREPATGTNPIAFAFRTLDEPFVVDMGASAFMGTDLIFQERRKAVFPEGVEIDRKIYDALLALPKGQLPER